MVVANPPWFRRVEHQGLWHFPIKTNESAGLFLQHILTQLRPEGRAIVIVPGGLLSRLLEQAGVRAFYFGRGRNGCKRYLKADVESFLSAVERA